LLVVVWGVVVGGGRHRKGKKRKKGIPEPKSSAPLETAAPKPSGG